MTRAPCWAAGIVVAGAARDVEDVLSGPNAHSLDEPVPDDPDALRYEVVVAGRPHGPVVLLEGRDVHVFLLSTRKRPIVLNRGDYDRSC